MVTRLNKQLVQQVFIVISACMAVAYLAEHVAWVTTASINKTVLWRTPVKPATLDAGFKDGWFVTFDTKSPLPNEGFMRAIKKVGCAPGEDLTVNDKWEYYCNGRYLGAGKAIDKLGRPTNRFSFNGPIPKESIFVIGDHKDSYDSRYIGFVTYKEIKERAYAIY